MEDLPVNTIALPQLLPPATDVVLQKIENSSWWQRAAQCVDSHYSNTSGVMLTHHLLAVAANTRRIFKPSQNPFLNHLFTFAAALGLHRETMEQQLLIVSLLHDIGKVDFDKTKKVKHPFTGRFATKRHPIMGVFAALEILEAEPLLSRNDKKIIYGVIEKHDVSYVLYREYKTTGLQPLAEKWRKLNDSIHPHPGAGLLYLLIFKLADIHGHANIDDVIWFYRTVNETYYKQFNLHLPIPDEKDIR